MCYAIDVSKMSILMLRRGRLQFIKIAIAAIIVVAIIYFLFSDSTAPTRVKQAFSQRLTANKFRERPIFVQGKQLIRLFFKWKPREME